MPKVSKDFKEYMDGLPSNSNKKEEPKVKKVVKGKTKAIPNSKKPLGKKLAETFIAEDLSTVKDHIIFDYAVPGIKNFIVNSIENAARMIFLGETSSPKERRSSSSKISYERYYRDKETGERIRPSDRYHFDDITFETYGDAEMVLESLTEVIDQYGQASVADFYELAGIKTQYTDNDYGWKSLGNARVLRAGRDGYELSLPRPRSLKG